MKIPPICLAVVSLFLTAALNATYFGNGLKIGEVDDHSAIIWTRLTENPEFNTQGQMFIEYEIPDSSGKGRKQLGSRYPEGSTLEDMAFSLPSRENRRLVNCFTRYRRSFLRFYFKVVKIIQIHSFSFRHYAASLVFLLSRKS